MTSARNLGSAGSALDAQYGSSPTANSNEPTLLGYDGTPHLYFPGTTGNWATVPDSAALTISTAFDVAVRVGLSDYSAGLEQTFIGQWNTTGGQQAWRFTIGGSGTLFVAHSTNGSTTTSTVADSIFPFVDGQNYWIRATWLGNNGAGSRVVAFYYAPDQEDEPASWTQIGSTITTSGTASIFNSTAVIGIGAQNGGIGNRVTGRYYRAVLRNAINGPVILDVDFTTQIVTGSETSVLDSSPTGAVCSIVRATAGRKAVAVVRPTWLLGLDDFFEVPDSPSLDLDATSSGTVLTVTRAWDTQVADEVLVAKAAGASPLDLGWRLVAGSSVYEATGYLSDGISQTVAVAPARAQGDEDASWLLRDRDTLTATGSTNITDGTPVADATTDLSTGTPMRIGALSGSPASAFADVEVRAVAVWRRALTDAERNVLVQYYGV